MTEAEAQRWTFDRFGGPLTEQITAFLRLVTEENRRQNLIAPSTVASIWTRHVVDSLQLVALSAKVGGPWIDIGTGGGFPGLLVGLVTDFETILVEPRRRRAEFLATAIDKLALGSRITVIQRKIEALTTPAGIISARAVASLENLLHAAAQCATLSTRWLLPRGRFELAELTALRRNWDFVFHVEQSTTDLQSTILRLEGVRKL